MKYLYWRGDSLWACYPIPGLARRYPLDIKRMKRTKTETEKCEALGWDRLTEWRDRASKKLPLFDIIEAPKKAEPKILVYRLLWDYWKQHYRFLPSARWEWPGFFAMVRTIGAETAESFSKEERVRNWMNEARGNDYAINTINSRLRILKAAFKHCGFPFPKVDSMAGGNVRGHYLSQFDFERNYHFLSTHKDPGARQFSKYYLALWETIRRPKEVAQYRIEDVDQERSCIMVRPEITKSGKFDEVAISERLWEIIEPELLRNSGLLFPNANGGLWVKGRTINYQKQMMKLKKKFGRLAGWCRDTRRGSATARAESGTPASSIKDQAGWSTWSSFSRYHIGTLESKRGAVSGTNLSQQKKAA